MCAQVCSEHGVNGYPTLLFFHKKKAVEYTGQRTKQALLEFAQAKINAAVCAKSRGDFAPVRSQAVTTQNEPAAEEENGVLVGTSQTFDSLVSGPGTFVDFFAPWYVAVCFPAPTSVALTVTTL